ncbi:hypothetical protein [Litoribaculum gwangyangense]|uniref:Uncharacterized protein n=1 Tax=Litoribaculum gwangyangense TaxID=1130722 RepID=A0ABP9CFV9_9FLAO
MEPIQNYISFNSNKSILELQYSISSEIYKMENLKLELEFYLILLDKPLFESYTINLYERLTDFKKEAKGINESRIHLLESLYSHANHISNKIECDNIACDNFFIKQHDEIELTVFNFHKTISDFKFRLFQYLESVLIN